MYGDIGLIFSTLFRFNRFFNAVRNLPTEYKVRKAKKEYIKLEPRCAVCGLKRNILTDRKNDVHHKIPVHVDDSLAFDFSNLITLCRTHHFTIGHLGNWKEWNKRIETTIDLIKNVLEEAKKY